MRFVSYRQQDSMDCGPTCLRIIAKHYGRTISQESLREQAQIGKEGVNLLGISDAAEKLGFRTIATKLTVNQLISKANLPAILHWNQDHFVVLYKIRANRFYISDPAQGLVQLSKNEFEGHWVSDAIGESSAGVVLLVEPTPLFFDRDQSLQERTNAGNSSGLTIRNIFRYLLPHKKLGIQLILGIGIASIMQMILPFLTQSVVDTGINTHDLNFIHIILLAQLALFAGRLAIEFVRSWILLHISSRINLSILTDFLIKLMNLPVSFFDSRKTGDIMQRMNDHSRIESFLTGSSLNVLFSLLNLTVFSFVLATFNTGIFAVFIAAALLYSCWIILFLRKRKRLDYKRFEIAAKEQGNMIQLIQGMQEIKLNGVEKTMRWTWEGLQAKLFKLSMKGLSLNQWQQAGALFINEGKNIFITFLSAKAVIEGQMTLGTMLAVQYIIGQLNSPIEQMIGFLQSWQNATISMDRLNEIHQMEDEEPSDKTFLHRLPVSFMRQVYGAKNNDLQFEGTLASVSYSGRAATEFAEPESVHPEASLHFHNVSFTYAGAGNEPVLKNINLSIPKGRTTAIVGTSGSGKTTLLKLLLKFYSPQKGEIKMGTTSLTTLSHRLWRSHCGVVMQESFIFSDTIAKNIAVGQERVDMEKLREAARVANILEFIDSLPLGFNTKIGAEGNSISMGQKQRILIARAVYRDPAFVFFDEATNSLDANNESAILKNLEHFLTGRTVVVVAHRLSTVKNADQIIVLNKGCITECGTHQELINLHGEYFHLVKNQLELGS